MENLFRKKPKKIVRKRIQQLAENDFVDPSWGNNFNDGDIHNPEGVTVRTSDTESRNASTQLTLAEAERLEADDARDQLH